jgi:flagellar basal-body rod protein FlgF
MIDALGAAVASMGGDVQQMSVTAQNLANVSTTGFKRQMIVGRSFADVLAVTAPGESNSFAVALPRFDAIQDLQSGTLRSTSNPLDFAIEGKGFFQISTAAGPRYTRQGNFHVDSLGRLVGESGSPVMGVAGEILLKSAQVSVDARGRLFEGERQIAQLRTVRFANPQALVNVGDGLFAAGADSLSSEENTDRVRQGFLEGPNVNSTREMVKMIETVRHFEAGQRVVQAYDEMLDRALSKLGEFQ